MSIEFAAQKCPFLLRVLRETSSNSLVVNTGLVFFYFDREKFDPCDLLVRSSIYGLLTGHTGLLHDAFILLFISEPDAGLVGKQHNEGAVILSSNRIVMTNASLSVLVTFRTATIFQKLLQPRI